MHVRMKLGLVAASVAALGLSACGSDSLSGEPAGSSAPSVSVSQNQDLSAKLPESIKSAGVIKVGTDSSYAPNEFLAGDGKTIQGMDVDVFNAVAAKFGVKAEYQTADFASIINGVNGKKYDIGISSFTINDERKKQVNMVSYFSAGTQWASAEGNPKGVDPENACGKTIAVQTGTVQDTDDLPVRAEGVRQRRDQGAALRGPGPGDQRGRHRQGRRDARRLPGGRVRGQAVRRQAGAARRDLRGGAVRLRGAQGRDRVRRRHRRGAEGDRRADGAYEAALEKWGVEDGAISDFAVNP